MKKTILISFLFTVYFSAFTQEKKDSANSKNKLLKTLINFSIGSEYNINTYNFQWQSDFSYGIILKRHTLSVGIDVGPGLNLYPHYIDDNVNSINAKVDYLSYQQDYSKWSIFGGNLSYQLQLNNIKSITKNSLILYSSFLRYSYLVAHSGDDYLRKKQINCLFGYALSSEMSNKFSFGFQLLSGIFYNIDNIPYTLPNSNEIFYSRLNKLFPVIIFKFNTSYNL